MAKFIDPAKWRDYIRRTSQNFNDIKTTLRLTDFAFTDLVHKRLIDEVLEFKEYIESVHTNSSDADQLNDVYKKLFVLRNHAREIFDWEEKLSDLLKLNGRADHKLEHESVMEQIDAILFDLRSGRKAVSGNLRHEVLNIITSHFNEKDLKMYPLSKVQSVLERSDIDGIRYVFRYTGVPQRDEEILDVSYKMMDYQKILDAQCRKILNAPADDMKAACEEVIAAFTTYAKNEEFFMREQNNIFSFEKQKDEHEAISAIFQEVLDLVGKKSWKKALKTYWELILDWVVHVNLTDYATHRLENWAIPLIELSESVEDIEWLLKTTDVGFLNKYQMEILEEMLTCEFFDNEEGETQGQRKESELDFFDRIIRKMRSLFYFEELELDVRDFSHFERISHKREHEIIISMLSVIRERCDTGGQRLSTTLKIKLVLAWLKHVNYWDSRYYSKTTHKVKGQSIWDDEVYTDANEQVKYG